MAQNIKTIQGVALASIKTIEGIALASIKTIQGVDNTGGGGGTPAFVEFANSAGSDSSSTQTISLTVASGATIVVGTKWEDAARTVSCSSNLDASGWTQLTPTSANSQVYGTMFYRLNCTAGAHTITVNYGAVSAFVRAAAWELSGVTALDGEGTPGTTNSGVGTLSSGNVATTNAVEVLISTGANYIGSAATVQAGWTEDYDPNAFLCSHFTTSSSGTYHGENNVTTTGGAEIVLFAAFR